MKDNRRIETRPVDSLQAYPRQAEMFGDLSEPELLALAADIEKNGLQCEIEILSDGTIVAGHQRLRAVKLLGLKTVQCWVREDLVEQGEAAIEMRFIEDNLNRRHLTKLSIARSYLHLRGLQQEANGELEAVPGDLRDHLGKRFGMSGRSLDRLAKMLDGPVEVQRAFERDQLTQDAVLSVVRLSPANQEAIAKRIRSGEKPADVVADVLQRPAPTPQVAQRAFRGLMTALRSARNKLYESIEEIGSSTPARDLEVLHEFAEAIAPRLIKRLEEDQAAGEDLSDLDEFLPQPGHSVQTGDQQESDSPDVSSDNFVRNTEALKFDDAVSAIKQIACKR